MIGSVVGIGRALKENLVMIAEALVVMSRRRKQRSEVVMIQKLMMIAEAMVVMTQNLMVIAEAIVVMSLRKQEISEVVNMIQNLMMIVRCPPMIVRVESVINKKGQRRLVRNVVSKGVMIVMGVVILLSSSLARGRVLLGH
jgi:hypothetical protein